MFIQLDKSREGRKVLEIELDNLKGKMSRIGNDFKDLQKMLDQQEATIRHTRSVNHQVTHNTRY